MYQIIHTIYQTDEVIMHQAKNGNIPMVSIQINRKLELLPLAQCGGLCLKLLKDLGAKIETTNPKIILIEDARIQQNKTELFFIGQLFCLTEQERSESHRNETVKKYLITLYNAYSVLLKQHLTLDFSIYNLYLVQDQLKVLDLGFFRKKIPKDSTPTSQLAMLIIKLFLPRQQYKPLKYMNSDQQINYVRKFNDFDVLIPLLEEGQKRMTWENLGYYLQSDHYTAESTPYCLPPKQSFKLSQAFNSYSLAIQRVQSNVRSRSRKSLISEHKQTANLSQESEIENPSQYIRQRRMINPNIKIIRPNSISSTPNNKTENNFRHSPAMINTYMKTESLNTSFKTENPFKSIQQIIDTDYFQGTQQLNQTLTPQESESNFISISSIQNQPTNQKRKESQKIDQQEYNTLQILQEKSTIHHQRHTFKLPQHKQLPSYDNDQTISVIDLEEDLTSEFDQYNERYRNCIECLNLIGKTVAKCITVLDAKNNLWIMPLFIVFKRMYQLRKLIVDDLYAKKNNFKLKFFRDYTLNERYFKLVDELTKQNDIVKSEVETLLKSCESKIDKLDKKNQSKIQPLLNSNTDQNIRDISFIYFYQQIYGQIKRMMTEKPKQAQSLRDLVVKIQCSLIIMDMSPYDQDFNMKEYLIKKSDEVYRQENEQKLDKIKQRIQIGGYQF